MKFTSILGIKQIEAIRKFYRKITKKPLDQLKYNDTVMHESSGIIFVVEKVKADGMYYCQKVGDKLHKYFKREDLTLLGTYKPGLFEWIGMYARVKMFELGKYIIKKSGREPKPVPFGHIPNFMDIGQFDEH